MAALAVLLMSVATAAAQTAERLYILNCGEGVAGDIGVTTRFVQNCTLSRTGAVLSDNPRHGWLTDVVETGHIGT